MLGSISGMDLPGIKQELILTVKTQMTRVATPSLSTPMATPWQPAQFITMVAAHGLDTSEYTKF